MQTINSNIGFDNVKAIEKLQKYNVLYKINRILRKTEHRNEAFSNSL